MKISYDWLNDYLEHNESLDDVLSLLTEIGLEVEGTETVESIPGGLRGVVVGRVLTCEQHPNADRLKVTTVDVGTDEPLQIVCGAANVAEGQKVPVATIGTTIYPPEGEPFQIKKGKLRGEASMGMICAEDELGLGESHDGIMVLNEDAVVGTTGAEYFDIKSDTVIEIGLTPNRADSMSHYGVARDLHAVFQRYGRKSTLKYPNSELVNTQKDRPIKVEVRNTQKAPRYAGLVLNNIKVSESPAWLQNRLKAIGLSPINNVVDITNYVNHELGQPLHAFDAKKIKGNKVIVDTLAGGSKFVTLDEKERELDGEDLDDL
jgi:phenylalanyl-tRNA synthetase beta chain